MDRVKAQKQLLWFLALVLAFSAILEGALIHFKTAPGLTIPLIMWSPGVAALIVMARNGPGFAGMGWKLPPMRFHFIAIALPIVYGGLAYVLAALFGLAGFAGPDKLAALQAKAGFEELPALLGLPLAILLIFGGSMVGGFARALGEEIGWRGFATPRMNAVFGFVLGTLLTGAIWAAWHMPAILFSVYNGGGEPGYELLSFAIMVISSSGVFAWVRMRSGSLWPAATLHAAHNVIIQSLLDPLSTRGSSDITMVGEFGIVLAVVTLLVSLPFWIMGARLHASS